MQSCKRKFLVSSVRFLRIILNFVRQPANLFVCLYIHGAGSAAYVSIYLHRLLFAQKLLSCHQNSHNKDCCFFHQQNFPDEICCLRSQRSVPKKGFSYYTPWGPPPPSPPQNLTKLFILVFICQPFGRVLIL